MANSIIMPKTGMAMEEGILLEWFVKEGDTVKKGDVVAEIETDKSTMELESDYDGVILALLCAAGETVPVTRVIAWIGKPGEAVPEETVPGAEKGPKDAVKDSPPAGTLPAGGASGESTPDRADGRVKATPAARKAGDDRNVDLLSVSPSGKHGEVLKQDVISAWDKKTADTGDTGEISATPLARRAAADQGISLSTVTGSGHGGKIFSSDLLSRQPASSGGIARPDTRVPLTGIQKITGKRMLESHQQIPVVTENTRADVTEMLEIRKRLNETLDIKISVNDFVLAATVRALLDNPRMNAVLDGGDLIYRGSINLGMAVAAPKGLLVPVIHDAQNLTLTGLAARAGDLASRGREGRLSQKEMSGGTFTVSNVGMYGITAFTPIINPPEAGILGVCSIEDELKLKEGAVVSRKLMGLSLTFDHRIVDGAEAAVFLKRLREYLESPLMILV